MASDELRFKHIGLSSDGAVVFCEMDNGKTYAMPLCALERAEEWNANAKPKTVKIIHDGFAAIVRFDTKISIDFPSDFVLHICEGKGGAMSDVGKRIREIREARGLTLDALAAKCGIAKPNLSRLENDKVTPRLETLRAVAAGLGIHPTLLTQKRAWTQTLHEFREWKDGLAAKEVERKVHVGGSDLVKTFLATRPEHEYAYGELLEYARGTRWVHADKSAGQGAAAKRRARTETAK